MIVTTMNDIPGYEVQEVFGEVMGLTVRSRIGPRSSSNKPMDCGSSARSRIYREGF